MLCIDDLLFLLGAHNVIAVSSNPKIVPQIDTPTSEPSWFIVMEAVPYVSN